VTTLLCDECGKNKATVHLTEIVNDAITKLNLCENCAKQKGAEAEQHFGIADLLSALTDTEHATPGAPSPTSGPGSAKHKCSHCGLTYEDFKRMGRLGCGECYKAFRTSLAPLLKRIHGSSQHIGKSPSPQALDEQKANHKSHEELEKAKFDLQKAVKNEEFEVAAALRDKIKFLEKKMKTGNKV
jgi:protein arginine kinase activator